MRWNLELRKDALRADIIAAASDGLTEMSLNHERLAKSRLVKGRGVVTGTLRRSIHAADVDYNFGSDDVQPSPGAPERGGRVFALAERNGKLIVTTGSGMKYARKIDDRYGYLSGTHKQAAAELPSLIEKHAKKRGLL